MKYLHYDGSVCRRKDEVWIIEKVHTPKLGVEYKEEVGDPCPYCNKYPEDVTGLTKWYRWYFNRTSMGFGLALIGLGLAMAVLDLFLGLAAGTSDTVLTAVAVAFDVFTIWLGVVSFSYNRARGGQQIEG